MVETQGQPGRMTYAHRQRISVLRTEPTIFASVIAAKVSMVFVEVIRREIHSPMILIQEEVMEITHLTTKLANQLLRLDLKSDFTQRRHSIQVSRQLRETEVSSLLLIIISKNTKIVIAN